MQIMVLVAKQFETTAVQYIITRVRLNQTEKGTVSSLKVKTFTRYPNPRFKRHNSEICIRPLYNKSWGTII